MSYKHQFENLVQQVRCQPDPIIKSVRKPLQIPSVAVGHDSVAFDLTWLKWQAVCSLIFHWFRISKFCKIFENSKIKNLIFGNILDRLVEWLLMSFKLEGEFKSFFFQFWTICFMQIACNWESSEVSWSHEDSRIFLFLHVFTNSRIFVTW